MGIVVSCANLATIYHNTKYSGGNVVNYLHISLWVFGMHLERVRHLTICRTMEFFLACLKSATKPFNDLIAYKNGLIHDISATLRQTSPPSSLVGRHLLWCMYRANPENKEQNHSWFSSWGDPLGARTQDPNIKSVVLYQLS